MIPDTRQTWQPNEHKTSPRLPPTPRQLSLLSSSLKPAQQQKMTRIVKKKKEIKVVKDTTQTSTDTWGRENMKLVRKPLITGSAHFLTRLDLAA